MIWDRSAISLASRVADHGHPEVDGHREDEAAAVVGVLADQVDPPGGMGGELSHQELA